MKAAEIRDMNALELDNPMRLKAVKKDIARVKTVITQRAMAGGEG